MLCEVDTSRRVFAFHYCLYLNVTFLPFCFVRTTHPFCWFKKSIVYFCIICKLINPFNFFCSFINVYCMAESSILFRVFGWSRLFLRIYTHINIYCKFISFFGLFEALITIICMGSSPEWHFWFCEQTKRTSKNAMLFFSFFSVCSLFVPSFLFPVIYAC